MYNYRSAVGPPDKYDIIGALQFHVLVEQGLRDRHTLLDVGCGSLRGGRLFLPYLRSGKYFGIEPNKHLVIDGINEELGGSIWAVKKPTFHYSGAFDLTFFNTSFDFILAQSIFSHAAPAMIDTCLSEGKKVLKNTGKFIATYFVGPSSYTGSTWAQSPDARYTEHWMRARCNNHGFSYSRLEYGHPSGQTWFMMRHQ